MKEPKVSTEEAMKMRELLAQIKPQTTPTSPEIREWFEKTALPTLKGQALSELHRNDEFEPKLIGFMHDGTMGIVDITKATRGTFGSRRSKDATAFVHKLAAMVPGTKASIFCTEAWALHGTEKKEMDRNIEKYPNLGDHPDRKEVMMFHMLHYTGFDDNKIMQLVTFIETIKVLGANRSRSVWKDTKLSDDVQITDPAASNEMRFTGRFIVGSEEEPK